MCSSFCSDTELPLDDFQEPPEDSSVITLDRCTGRGGEGEWLAVTAYVFGSSDALVTAFASFTQPCFPWVVFMYICTLYSRVHLSSKCILSWT